LQIPYLLNIALSLTTYLSAFPSAPAATFTLLRKLDHVFASLLKGEDSVSGESLPGIENGKSGGMSRTDMVRCKSLVEATRVLVVEVMSEEAGVEVERDGPEESGAETDAMSIGAESAWGLEDEKHNMDVARVYEATIMQLGELLNSKSGYDAGFGQS
jgi:hypothetical protein